MTETLPLYLERLRAVPFLRDVSVEASDVRVGGVQVDARLVFHTPEGKQRLYCETKSSNLSRELAIQVVAWGREVHPLIVAAPVIGAGVGDFLAEHGISYVDLRGNCDINLEGRYVARIQGQRGERPTTARALRNPSYQVLFALLADPQLLGATERALAVAASVSRQPAVTVRERLLELGYLLKGQRGFLWAPKGRRRALDLWLAGYAASLRRSLWVGSYQTLDSDPAALESRIADVLDRAGTWRWGGSAAAHRLTGYFRGEKTVVHVQAPPADLARQLGAVPRTDGPLVILRTPGPLSLRGATSDTAHPLLIYTELLTDGGERAAEAAHELAQRFSIGADS